jgi:alpha-galactosidase
VETATAVRWAGALDGEGFPLGEAWQEAPGLAFAWDWRGENADPERETEVRLLWRPATLFLRFCCRFRVLTTFTDSQADGRRYGLWDRDVAEVFLQPDLSLPRSYWEFEVAPNGKWIDLDIALGEKPPGHKGDPRSGIKVRTQVAEAKKVWTADMALPMRTLTAEFDAAAVWRTNFFRVEGRAEPRFYSCWQPTKTPRPDFHVPQAFGELRFR